VVGSPEEVLHQSSPLLPCLVLGSLLTTSYLHAWFVFVIRLFDATVLANILIYKWLNHTIIICLIVLVTLLLMHSWRGSYLGLGSDVGYPLCLGPNTQLPSFTVGVHNLHILPGAVNHLQSRPFGSPDSHDHSSVVVDGVLHLFDLYLPYSDLRAVPVGRAIDCLVQEGRHRWSWLVYSIGSHCLVQWAVPSIRSSHHLRVSLRRFASAVSLVSAFIVLSLLELRNGLSVVLREVLNGLIIGERWVLLIIVVWVISSSPLQVANRLRRRAY
jgi:hypothetical protein